MMKFNIKTLGGVKGFGLGLILTAASLAMATKTAQAQPRVYGCGGDDTGCFHYTLINREAASTYCQICGDAMPVKVGGYIEYRNCTSTGLNYAVFYILTTSNIPCDEVASNEKSPGKMMADDDL